MNPTSGWIKSEWLSLLLPILVFLAVLLLSFWLRKSIHDYLKSLISPEVWKANLKIRQAFQSSSSFLCLFVSLYLALSVAVIPFKWRNFVSQGIWTILLVSLISPLLKIVNDSLLFYGQKVHLERHAVLVICIVTRICILLLGVLLTLEIWQIPSRLEYILLALLVLVAVFSFPDIFPDFVAGIHFGASRQIKLNEYIKMEGGEEGYVIKIGWNNTLIQSIENNIVIIPNNYLLQHTLINYGSPLKKASQPFQFETLKIIKQPMGLKSRNVRDLVALLKTVPDEAIYCHICGCLEDNPYQILKSPNDFVTWIKDVLADNNLAFQLASVHSKGIYDLNILRRNFIAIAEKHLVSEPHPVIAPEGKEFYFIKGTSFITPTRFVARDLREFTEVLRRIELNSLYHHFLESRFHHKNGNNDFSLWLKDSLSEKELSEEIEQLNPYSISPEELRSRLIKTIEKRIK